MIVKCISFGSVWYPRLAADGAVEKSCLFNTTGIRIRRKKRDYMTEGVVRFNCNVRPPIRVPEQDLIGAVYDSPDGLRLVGTVNRLLLHPRLPDKTLPDYYLVRVSSERHGRINTTAEWRTDSVKVVASSSFDGRQEFLLLMGLNARIKTSLGVLDLPCLIKQ